MRRASLAVALAMLLGCATPTQIVVVVDTDLAIPSEIDSLRLRVTSPDGTSQQALAPLDPGTRPPRSLVLLHRGGALGPLRFEAEALLAGVVVAHTGRSLAFAAGSTTTVHVWLARACRGVDCGAQTCGAGGRCRPYEVDACDLDPARCADAGTPDAGPSDGGPADAGIDAERTDAGPRCTLAADGRLCGGIRAMHALGDRIAPMPCTALPPGVSVTYELRGPSGTLPAATEWDVRASGDYQLLATASAPAACTVSASFHVQRFDIAASTARPATTYQGFAARVGMAFVATRGGPYAVTRASGWRDLRIGTTGSTFSNDDVTGVTVRRDEVIFATTASHPPATRVVVSDDFSSIVLTDMALPTADRSARRMATAPGPLGSGDGLGAMATRTGAVVIEDTPAPFSARALPLAWDALRGVTIGTRESSARGAVWTADLVSMRNHAIGAGTAVAAGAPIPLGVTMMQALVVDDRDASAMRLATCSLDAGLRIYDLTAIGAALPAPIATVGGACRDVALDEDGSFWTATSAGLVRVDRDGSDRARPAAADGAPPAGVARVAVAWSALGREIWALTDTGDVHVASVSAP